MFLCYFYVSSMDRRVHEVIAFCHNFYQFSLKDSSFNITRSLGDIVTIVGQYCQSRPIYITMTQ